MQEFLDWLIGPSRRAQLYRLTGFEILRAYVISGGAQDLVVLLFWILQHLNELNLSAETEQVIVLNVRRVLFGLFLLIQIFQRAPDVPQPPEPVNPVTPDPLLPVTRPVSANRDDHETVPSK